VTTKTDGDRLLRAAVLVLSTTGWGLFERKLKPLRDVVEDIAPGRVERAQATIRRKAEERREAARWTGPVPAWAKRLVNKHAPDTHVTWEPSSHSGSSGHFQYAYGIHVTAGTDEVDNRRVLLHEIAHARTPGKGHSATFWDECYRLAVVEGMVESMKARLHQARSFTAAQRRARQNRSTQ
jgi:hypothetical protein